MQVGWVVEYTDEFGAWFEALVETAQDAIDRSVALLEEWGPDLPFPYSSGLAGFRHRHMRELRVQSAGERCVSSIPSIRAALRSC